LSLSQGLADLRDWPSLHQEVARLRTENARLQAENATLAACQADNRRLEALLDLRPRLPGPSLAARVAARDPACWYSQVVLDVGSAQGVRTDMIAVAPEGLVGKVFAVASQGCRVRLLLDPASAVPVTLASSGAVGILYGQGDSTCIVKYIDHDARVQEGEAVLTSGLGEIYPPRLVVGRVSRVLGRTEALFQAVQVRPAVDFGSLREVLVVGRAREP
jgi:rod shape-determining protein MreC